MIIYRAIRKETVYHAWAGMEAITEAGGASGAKEA
jgi:hypothetical protein